MYCNLCLQQLPFFAVSVLATFANWCNACKELFMVDNSFVWNFSFWHYNSVKTMLIQTILLKGHCSFTVLRQQCFLNFEFERIHNFTCFVLLHFCLCLPLFYFLFDAIADLVSLYWNFLLQQANTFCCLSLRQILWTSAVLAKNWLVDSFCRMKKFSVILVKMGEFTDNFTLKLIVV